MTGRLLGEDCGWQFLGLPHLDFYESKESWIVNCETEMILQFIEPPIELKNYQKIGIMR